MRTHPRTAALVLALALLGAACGSDSGTTAGDSPSASTAAPTEAPATQPPATEPATTEPAATEPDATGAGQPERIVSLSATATEMLFAIGAGPQVAAVDSLSNFPDDAPITDLSAFEANVEAIVGFDPDLVVLAYDPGDVVDGLTAVGVPTMLLPTAASLDDTFQQIEQLGAATGNVGGAAELVGNMTVQIDALIESMPRRDVAPTYYYELDDTLYTVTSQTFIGQLFALAGLENVADPADEDGAAFGYPQLSAEYLVAADPDLVFLADTLCCGQDAATVAARPGFDQLRAVKLGNVIELDDDVASRWGPRVVTLLQIAVDAAVTAPVS